MKKFEVGKTYSVRSICNHDCVWSYTEFDRIGADFKGIWHDYWGDHPEWKGRRVAFLPGHGTTLFIEGVSFEIVDDKRK